MLGIPLPGMGAGSAQAPRSPAGAPGEVPCLQACKAMAVSKASRGIHQG